MPTSNLRLFIDARLTSPYVMSVFVALQEKQLPFDISYIDLAVQAQNASDFAATSLTQRVPTLQHGAFSLSESSAITEYLDETFPGIALYPRDRLLRARARQVQAWIRSDMMPIREERSTEGVFYTPVDTPLSAQAQAAAEKLLLAADALLPEGAKNLFGEWSLADVDLAVMLQRLISSGDAVPARLQDYVSQQWQRPSVQAWLALQRPAVLLK